MTQSDDLGRVVIPKEIRRTLRIRVGDPLEIFTDREGEIILKKYSPIGELGAYAADYAESLAQTTGYIVCVADKDTMIAAAGTGKKECIGKAISQELEQMIQDRECLQATAGAVSYTHLDVYKRQDFSRERRCNHAGDWL